MRSQGGNLHSMGRLSTDAGGMERSFQIASKGRRRLGRTLYQQYRCNAERKRNQYFSWNPRRLCTVTVQVQSGFCEKRGYHILFHIPAHHAAGRFVDPLFHYAGTSGTFRHKAWIDHGLCGASFADRRLDYGRFFQ